jgi:hypothetical protein
MTIDKFLQGRMALVLSFSFYKWGILIGLKVHKIENFFDSNFGICVISLLVMSKY